MPGGGAGRAVGKCVTAGARLRWGGGFEPGPGGMRRGAPRGTLRGLLKSHKPQLRLAAGGDLLVRAARGARKHG